MRTSNTIGEGRYYECEACGKRTFSGTYRARCPECGGRLRNLAVPRE